MRKNGKKRLVVGLVFFGIILIGFGLFFFFSSVKKEVEPSIENKKEKYDIYADSFKVYEVIDDFGFYTYTMKETQNAKAYTLSCESKQCNFISPVKKAEGGYVLYQDQKNYKIIRLTDYKDVTPKVEYKKIKWFADFNTVFISNSDNKWAIYDLEKEQFLSEFVYDEGKEELNPDYGLTKLYHVGQNQVVVSQNHRYGMINLETKEVILDFINEDILYDGAYLFVKQKDYYTTYQYLEQTGQLNLISSIAWEEIDDRIVIGEDTYLVGKMNGALSLLQLSETEETYPRFIKEIKKNESYEGYQLEENGQEISFYFKDEKQCNRTKYHLLNEEVEISKEDVACLDK